MNRYLIFAGGLGNQMFQYAYMINLRHEGLEVKADISIYNCGKMHNGYELDKVFGINEDVVSRSGLGLLGLKVVRTYGKGLLVSTEEKPLKKTIFYDGYWQNEKFFENCKEIIREAFVFQDIDERNKEQAKAMRLQNSVSLHVRRGDYLGVASLEGICTEEYYRKAISVLMSKVESPVFYIFSNEPEWAENHFREYDINYSVINYNKGAESYKDMYLMTQSKHHILANSSFSWWGAWLGRYNDAVIIAPKRWNNRNRNLQPQLDSWTLL